LDNFSPLGLFITLDCYLKITKLERFFGLILYLGKSYILILRKHGLGYILAGFDTNSSGHPEANPTIAIYNAGGVKSYNATSSLVRFETKQFSSNLKKRSSLLQRWRCSCKFKSRRVGSWSRVRKPGLSFTSEIAQSKIFARKLNSSQSATLRKLFGSIYALGLSSTEKIGKIRW
jgi:hypothetical protein